MYLYFFPPSEFSTPFFSLAANVFRDHAQDRWCIIHALTVWILKGEKGSRIGEFEEIPVFQRDVADPRDPARRVRANKYRITNKYVYIEEETRAFIAFIYLWQWWWSIFFLAFSESKFSSLKYNKSWSSWALRKNFIFFSLVADPFEFPRFPRAKWTIARRETAN